MKKYLLIITLFIIQQSPAWCQLPQFTEIRKMDSLRLDSIKNMLPLLKGKARVNAMNIIATEFSYFAKVGGFKYREDSISYYAAKAYDEAGKIGYKPGIAMALLRLKAKDDTAKQKNVREAIRLGEETNDNTVLGWAYYGADAANFKKAASYFKKAGDSLREAEVSCWLCTDYINSDKRNDEEFKYCERSMLLSKQTKALNMNWKHFLVQYSLNNMADLYKAVGDYKTAMDYLRQARQYAIENNGSWTMEDVMSSMHVLLGQHDSALFYLQIYLQRSDVTNAYNKIRVGRTYLLMKDYKKALPLLQEGVNGIRKDIKQYFATCLIDLGKAYAGNKQYTAALKYAQEGTNLLQSVKSNNLQYLIDANELLSEINHSLGKNDLAYKYLKQYSTLKDSLQNKQMLWRLNNQLYKYRQATEQTQKEAQIGFLKRDNTIKQQQLKQQTFIRKALVTGLFLLLLFGILVFRGLTLKRRNERLQNEKKHADLQKRSSELEMQALRAQMNPHFIFNCLSSINKFILKNESRDASDYLTRFSRLIRMVLTNSQLSMIPLSDEIEMLRLYLDMERLRFNNSFNYNIVYANNIEPETIYIPPMILQPFCENAIWHGLMHKDGQGKLDIIMSANGEDLICTITDNGIGRAKAAELKSKSGEKQKSFGLKITTERLALFNNKKAVRTFYNSEDVLDQEGNVSGTEVTLNIKYKDEIHEPVS